MGVRGPKSKIEENSFVEGHREKWRPKMARFHRETNRRSNLKERDRQPDRGTDRESQFDNDS